MREVLAERGLLCKEHKGHLRIAPLLAITCEEIDLGVGIIAGVLKAGAVGTAS